MNGIVAVNGMALAAAHLILEQEVDTQARKITDVDEELVRLNHAKEKCIESLSTLKNSICAILMFSI